MNLNDIALGVIVGCAICALGRYIQRRHRFNRAARQNRAAVQATTDFLRNIGRPSQKAK